MKDAECKTMTSQHKTKLLQTIAVHGAIDGPEIHQTKEILSFLRFGIGASLLSWYVVKTWLNYTRQVSDGHETHRI